MSTRRSNQRVWALTVLGWSLAVATLVVHLIDQRNDALLTDTLALAIPVAFCAVGGLLATRRPGNAIGWLCLAIGLLWAIQGTSYTAAEWAGNSGEAGTAEWVGLLGTLWLPALGLTGTHLALRLPGGSLLSPRWRRYSHFCTIVLVVTAVLVATAPGKVADVRGTDNPLASEALQALGPVFILFALSVLGSIASVAVRYRRSHGIERLQLRWIALGGIFFLVAILAAILPPVLGLADEGSAPQFVDAVLDVAFTAIPVAVGIAVLRYRLYEIDVVVNRTLVYGALTATLAGAYLGSVLLLQLALSSITSGSSLAVAGSTLAVAGLFRPARARIQGAVDHRFYRRKYDAAQTLERFGAHLRDEVDLDSLCDELRGVVTETMQPAHVSLWLRAAR